MRRHLKLVHIRRFPREMNNGLHMHGRKGQKMKNPCETRCHHFALQVAAEGSVSEDERPVVSHSAITSLLMFPPLSHPKGLSGSCGSPQSLLPSPPLPVYRRSDLHAVSRRAEIPEREREKRGPAKSSSKWMRSFPRLLWETARRRPNLFLSLQNTVSWAATSWKSSKNSLTVCRISAIYRREEMRTRRKD